jgi:hypothetical protein
MVNRTKRSGCHFKPPLLGSDWRHGGQLENDAAYSLQGGADAADHPLGQLLDLFVCRIWRLGKPAERSGDCEVIAFDC